jgi:hypothetical protein
MKLQSWFVERQNYLSIHEVLQSNPSWSQYQIKKLLGDPDSYETTNRHRSVRHLFLKSRVQDAVQFLPPVRVKAPTILSLIEGVQRLAKSA